MPLAGVARGAGALAVLALLINALIWGVSWWPFRLLAAHGVHSLWATGLVYVIAAGLLLCWRPATLRVFAATPALWSLALAAGITNACFNWAVTIGPVVLLFYLMPVWSVLFARWLLHEPITPAALLRVLVAVSGAALVLWNPGAGLPLPASLSDWLGVAGGAGFAMTNVLLRAGGQVATAPRVLAMFSGGGLVAGGLAWLLTAAQAGVSYPPWQDHGWWALLLLLIGGFLVANIALQYGASRLPASITAVIMASEVVFASGSAMLIDRVQVDWPVWIGGALIVAVGLQAALAASRSEAPRREPT